ncbi:MAG: hypothetical protein MHPSP_002010, partial [Paramarteilia canceri]
NSSKLEILIELTKGTDICVNFGKIYFNSLHCLPTDLANNIKVENNINVQLSFNNTGYSFDQEGDSKPETCEIFKFLEDVKVKDGIFIEEQLRNIEEELKQQKWIFNNPEDPKEMHFIPNRQKSE